VISIGMSLDCTLSY